jgi:hypothetical protein
MKNQHRKAATRLNSSQTNCRANRLARRYACRLRKLVLAASPGITEEFKWGTAVWCKTVWSAALAYSRTT